MRSFNLKIPLSLFLRNAGLTDNSFGLGPAALFRILDNVDEIATKGILEDEHLNLEG